MNRVRKVSRLYAERYNRPDHRRRAKEAARKRARQFPTVVAAKPPRVIVTSDEPVPTPAPPKKQGMMSRIFRHRSR